MSINVVIKRINGEDLFCPIIICDFCKEEISDAKNGNAQWMSGESGTVADDNRLFFTHKQCCRAFESTRGGRSLWMWESLSKAVFQLAMNLNLNLKGCKK